MIYYDIYSCARCKYFILQPQKRPEDFSIPWIQGFCKAQHKAPIMNSNQYGLFKTPKTCEFWEIGKPRKIKKEGS